MQAFLLYCRRPALRISVIGATTALVITYGALVVFLPQFPAQATDRQASVNASVAWLRTQQNADGSFPGFSAVGGTADGVYALIAGDQDPRDVSRPGGANPLEFLETKAGSVDCSTSDRSDCNAGAAGKIAAAAEASSGNPRRFGGSDLIAAIKATFDENSGAYRETKFDPVSGKYSYLTNMFDQAFAILGLAGSHVRIPRPAISNLLSAQQQDGGWEFSPGWGTDTNSTALALQALVGAERADPRLGVDAALRRAVDFFHAEQNGDGGFAYQKAFPYNSCGGQTFSDTNSTAYSVQAVLAAGEDPAGSEWIGQGAGPFDFLASVQNSDGSFHYQQGPGCTGDVGATSQAIPAVAGKSFVCLVRLGTCPASYSAVGEDSSAGAGSPVVAAPSAEPPGSASPVPRTDASPRAPGSSNEISKPPRVAAGRQRPVASSAPRAASASPSPATVPTVSPIPSLPDASPTPKRATVVDSKSAPEPQAAGAVGRSGIARWSPLNWVGAAAALLGGGLLIASLIYHFLKRRRHPGF